MEQRLLVGGFAEFRQENLDEYLEGVDSAWERCVNRCKKKHSFFKIAQIWHLCFRFGAPGQSQQAQPELHGEDGAAGGGEPTGQV